MTRDELMALSHSRLIDFCVSNDIEYVVDDVHHGSQLEDLDLRYEIVDELDSGTSWKELYEMLSEIPYSTDTWYLKDGLEFTEMDDYDWAEIYDKTIEAYERYIGDFDEDDGTDTADDDSSEETAQSEEKPEPVFTPLTEDDIVEFFFKEDE